MYRPWEKIRNPIPTFLKAPGLHIILGYPHLIYIYTLEKGTQKKPCANLRLKHEVLTLADLRLVFRRKDRLLDQELTKPFPKPVGNRWK